MHNPYAPPTAPVGDVTARRGSGIKAVLAGLAVDIGGSILASVVLTMAYAMSLAGTGADETEIASSLAEIPADSWVYMVGIVAGCLFSALGGYVCARIARHSEYRLGAILATVSAASGLMMGSDAAGPMFNIALASAGFASTMAGAWLGVSRNARNRPRQPQPGQQE